MADGRWRLNRDGAMSSVFISHVNSSLVLE
jgi:hypothetical protein